jgi:hypothetical protein
MRELEGSTFSIQITSGTQQVNVIAENLADEGIRGKFKVSRKARNTFRLIK